MTSHEAVIIGGGVIGASVAYHLALRGVRALVLERAGLCTGASGGNGGLVWPQATLRTLGFELTMASFARFPALAEELEADVEYERPGGLIGIEAEALLPMMREYVAAQRALDLPVELLDGAEARRREPTLAPNLGGAVYAGHAGRINPFLLTRAFLDAARRRGAAFRPLTPVVGLRLEGGRVAAVRTPHGEVPTGLAIVAAGSWSAEVARLTGLEIPVVPRQGMMIVTEAAPFRTHHVVKPLKHDRDPSVFSQPHPPGAPEPPGARHDPNLPPGKGMGISQVRAGNFVLGSTSRFAGFDLSPTAGGIGYILEHARRVLPALGRLHVIRTWAGLRPNTPDGLPLIGPVETVPGLFLATGHDGSGVGLAPVTGQIAVDLIMAGRPAFPAERLAPTRFLQVPVRQ